jgi:hypothetical protein
MQLKQELIFDCRGIALSMDNRHINNLRGILLLQVVSCPKLGISVLGMQLNILRLKLLIGPNYFCSNKAGTG